MHDRSIEVVGYQYELVWLCRAPPYTLLESYIMVTALCSEGPVFRRSYVQKVLCSEIFVQKVLCLESTLAIKQYYLFNLSESV